MTTEEMQKQIESQMPTPDEVIERIGMTEEECEKKVREIINKATRESLMPFLAAYPKDVVMMIFRIGFHTGLDCGKYVTYNKED